MDPPTDRNPDVSFDGRRVGLGVGVAAVRLLIRQMTNSHICAKQRQTYDTGNAGCWSGRGVDFCRDAAGVFASVDVAGVFAPLSTAVPSLLVTSLADILACFTRSAALIHS
jgi:hypothetical protein